MNPVKSRSKELLMHAGFALGFLLCLMAASAVAAPVPASAPATATTGSAAASGQVSLSLSEYERLTARGSITVVESLRVSGSFAGHDLQLQLVGRSSGQWPRVTVLQAGPGVAVHACEGDAIVGRESGSTVGSTASETGRSGFELVPLAARFGVRCRLTTSNSDRLQIDTTPAVLWVESQVSDGELSSVATSELPSDGSRRYQVVRVSAGSSAVLPTTATARYRISLQPEATQFAYQITAWNPNRQHQTLTVSLRSGEHVQKVEAGVRSEPVGNVYRFEIPPGEQTLSLIGTIASGDGSQGTLRSPLSAAVHYVLIESHPLLRPAISLQGGQRISPAETGLSAQHRGAQGFALRDGDALSWKVQRLEPIHTTSFALPLSRHTFFLSADGQVLGETQLRIDNEGAAALTMPMHAAPSYASLQQAPILLTQDESGSLWIPLGSGTQEVLVQHRQTLRRGGGFALASLWLPEAPIAASQSTVELRFGQEWLPLYVELAPELRLPFLDLGSLLALLLLFLWSERLLALLSLRLRHRLLIASGLSLSALLVSWVLVLLIVANLALSIALSVVWLSRRRFTVWAAIGGLCLGGLVFLIGAALLLSGSKRASVSSEAALSSAPGLVDSRAGEDSKPEAVDGKKRGRDASAYEGLPAKFTLPYGHAHSTFHRELLSTSPPRPLYALMISRVAIDLLGVFLAGVAVLFLLAQRRLVYLGFVDLWERLSKRAEPAK
jgi:hypothetical protein